MDSHSLGGFAAKLKSSIDLVVHLTRNPQFAPQYWQLRKASTLDSRIPWTSFSAIERLRKTIKPGTKIMEFGSGGSTLFFLDLGATVVSLEGDPEWANVVRSSVAAPLNERFALLEVDYSRRSEPEAYLEKIAEYDISDFDFIFVDFPENPRDGTSRTRLLQALEPKLKRGSVALLDDSWRYPFITSQTAAAKTELLRSVGPSRPGVTEALMFYY
jgi:hypothetical protein